MRVAVLGAGCVGSVVASRLHDAGNAVSLIASGDRAARLCEEGLTVNGRRYDLPIMEEGSAAPDLVVVGVKNYQLEEACRDMAGLVGEGTLVLPLLNSVSPTPAIERMLPDVEVLYGYISKIDTLRTGREFSYNIAGDIHFGRARNPEPDERLEAIASMLSEAGFGTCIDEDMIRAVWKKWMLNIGANQVSALAEADYLQFAAIPEVEKVLRMAMDELLMLAHRENVNLLQSDAEELIRYLTSYPFPKKTSMLQDVLNRRKTEVEAISGEVVALSRKWRQPCPVNETMYYLIKAKEQAYLGSGDGRGSDPCA